MNYNQYNGNIFNPKDIFKLKEKYLILGGKKYIFIFNSQDFQIERKIKLNEYCSYSLIAPSNDRNYICIIINNKIIVYQFLSDILNFEPIVEKNINIKVHSMIFEKEKLILYEDKLTIETMRIQQPYNWNKYYFFEINLIKRIEITFHFFQNNFPFFWGILYFIKKFFKIYLIIIYYLNLLLELFKFMFQFFLYKF